MEKFEVWSDKGLLMTGDDLSLLIDKAEEINEPAEVWSVTWDEVCFSRTQCQMISSLHEVMHVNRVWREKNDQSYKLGFPYRPNLDDERFFVQ